LGDITNRDHRTMTKTKVVFLALFSLTIAACGGRSTMHIQNADDGGGVGEAGAKDGKRDGLADTPSNVPNPDVPILEDVPPSNPDTSGGGPQPDTRPADAPINRDVRGIDVGTAFETLRPDGGPIGNPDGRGPDGRAPGDGLPPPAEVGRGDANPRTDQSINPPDGRPRPDGGPGVEVGATLTGIEITPPNPTVVVGVPLPIGAPGLVVTALYSDGTSADVTASATFTSSDTTVLQVSGRTLSGQKAGSATITATYQGRTATAQATVSASPLQSISVDSVVPVTIGQYILITATGVFADGTKQDITGQVTWSVSDSTLVTLALDTATSKEKVTGVKAGTGSIAATLQGITGKSPLTVTAATITAIAVTPPGQILQQGVSMPYKATATYSDGTTGDVTSQATWSSDTAAVAVVTSNATGVLVRAVGAGTATISATVGTIVGSTSVTVTTPVLVSIALVPATWSPNVGAKQAFVATGTYSDNTTADVTISASWISSNANVASVSNAAGQKGQATAMAVGSAEVRATLGGITGTAQVTVAASPLVSIKVTPDPLSVILGLTGKLTATGSYQNGTTQDLTTQVAWSIEDGSIATISNAAGTAGQVAGIVVGNTTAVATLSGISGKAAVNVTTAKLTEIKVSPATATVTAGGKQQFTATGTYDNGTTLDLTTQVTWSSGSNTVAQISNAAGSNGLATSLVQGTATITATMGTVSGTATLTVGAPLLSSIMIAPAAPSSIDVGGTRNFTVTAVYQNGNTAQVAGTWSASPTSVATVATTGGGRGATATGVAPGTATITVTYEGMSASATLTVTAVPTLVGLTITPESVPTLLVGATQQLQANAVYSDGNTTTVTTTASWTSNPASVASVSGGGGGRDGGPGGGGGGRGLVTAIGAGTATITATYQGFTATITITVRDPAPTALVITPANPTIRVGATQQFAAVVALEDGTTQTVTNQASWTTSSGTIASITTSGGGGGGPGGGGGRGLATGIAAGQVTVTATYSNLTATTTLTVTKAVPTSLVVTPPSPTIQVGQTQAFVATMVYDDNTTANVTAQASWTSSAPSVATIQTSGGGGGGPGGGGPGGGGGGAAVGTASASAIGVSTISATFDGFTGTATLTVVDPPLASVQVTPTNPTVPLSATQQFAATAVFTDNTRRDVTTLATWSSSDSSIALVNGQGANIGRLTARAEGKATITATYNGVSGSSVVTVATVQSITVTPTNPTTVVGLPLSFAATAALSNGTSLVVANGVDWVSSDSTTATVTANGLATPVKSGSATITATYLGKSGSTTLTVSSATLSSIAVAPASVSVAVGGNQQLTATGTYSDSKTYDLTTVATWLPASSSIATVSNAPGSAGLLTGVAAGNTTVTASFGAVTSSPATPVTVTP
jgi:trimeric autotransporter adhesin